jgi:hypothetical protein
MGNVLDLSNCGTNQYLQLGRILLETIPADRKGLLVGKVMAYIAEQTIQSARRGDSAPQITTKAIHADLGGNQNVEPSAWLSPLWKQINTQYYPQIKDTLIERCRAEGLTVYPAITKSDGKPVHYWLTTREIPQGRPEVDAISVPDNSLPNTIQYKKDLTLQLSTAGRIVIGNGMNWTSLKRYSYLTWKLALLLGVGIVTLSLWFLLWLQTAPLSGRDIVVLAAAVGLPCFAHRPVTEIWQLFEDRIIVAPDWMLTWKERGATIEIIRSLDTAIPSEIKVSRYTATCPICSRMIRLDKGEPDFPWRLIGRCEENPREHVFSFDRSTQLGTALR